MLLGPLCSSRTWDAFKRHLGALRWGRQGVPLLLQTQLHDGGADVAGVLSEVELDEAHEALVGTTAAA